MSRIRSIITNRLNRLTGKIIKRKVIKYAPEYGLNRVPRKNKIIVSLTSYGHRLQTVDQTIKSLLMQTEKPDEIILWVDPEVNSLDLPTQLLKLRKFGLTIQNVETQLRPHKKYLYTMVMNPDAIVITVDDDAYYSPKLVKNLMKFHQKYPDAIVARRVHLIRYDANNQPLPYMHWTFNYTQQRVPSRDLFATGVGGVLYPPHLLPAQTTDVEFIKNNCLNADDVWLKFMEWNARVPVVWARCFNIVPEKIDPDEIGLAGDNVFKGLNDKYIESLNEKFNVF